MMFDLVYPAGSDEVYSNNNGYSDYENNLIQLSGQTHQVTKYTTKINSTKTQL